MGTILSILIFLITFIPVIGNNTALGKQCPECKSFGWGFFIGWFGIITSMLNILVIGSELRSGWFGVVGMYMYSLIHPSVAYLYFVTTLIFSYLIIVRNKYGWLIGSILWLNPIIWVINFFYGKKRWSEFDHHIDIKFFKLISKKFFDLTSTTRIFILSPVLWIAVALSFIYIFQPYGRSISSREEIEILKILFIPPVVFFFGLFLYKIALHKK